MISTENRSTKMLTPPESIRGQHPKIERTRNPVQSSPNLRDEEWWGVHLSQAVILQPRQRMKVEIKERLSCCPSLRITLVVWLENWIGHYCGRDDMHVQWALDSMIRPTRRSIEVSDFWGLRTCVCSPRNHGQGVNGRKGEEGYTDQRRVPMFFSSPARYICVHIEHEKKRR